MRKLESIQLPKLISGYGGVGSLIETNTNGSLIILPYNEWKCFSKPITEEITDQRLLFFVKNSYPHVKRLLSIPDDDLSNKSDWANNNDIKSTITSRFFPEWYYCPKCRRLKKIDNWKEEWDEFYPKDKRFAINPPACPYCSIQRGKKNISRYKLHQLRFVMASLTSGELEDVPFNRLWRRNINGISWTEDDFDNSRSNLKYISQGDSDGLHTINIVDVKTGEKISLAEIERHYIISGKSAYKMVVKGSQSLYMPNIVRSLYIPIENQPGNSPSTSDEFDLQEFRYLTNDESYINDLNIHPDFQAKRETHLDNKAHTILRITALERLKETSVLLSYTRLGKADEPREWFNAEKGRVESNLNPKEVSPFSSDFPNPWYMPAVEAHGEGLLFEVDVKDLKTEDMKPYVHTLCHTIMKEMEFECGYPLQSLKEKIYVDYDNNAAGFLIYTIGGSEGSYGGLISLADNDAIIKLINRGVRRAQHCPNDPICMSESDGHCFACLDLPETSCALFNSDLKRKLLLEVWKPFFNSAEVVSSETSIRPEGLIL